MALPDTFAMSRNGARFFASRILVDGETADTDGVWFDTLQLHPFTITIGGDFVLTPSTGGITVLVSNGVLGYTADSKVAIGVKPADADNHWPALGPDLINAPYSVLSDGPYRWVKIRIQGLTAGSVKASWSAAVTVGEKG